MDIRIEIVGAEVKLFDDTALSKPCHQIQSVVNSSTLQELLDFPTQLYMSGVSELSLSRMLYAEEVRDKIVSEIYEHLTKVFKIADKKEAVVKERLSSLESRLSKQMIPPFRDKGQTNGSNTTGNDDHSA